MNHRISNSLSTYKKEFSAKLANLETNSLEINQYPKIYLQHLVEHREYYLDIYEEVIKKIAENIEKKVSDVFFVDYGSGNGLLAIFAAYIGFGKVVGIDVDEQFYNAGKKTAEALGITAVEFINGTEAELKNISFKDQPIVIAGTDVIEHIYNLNHFFGVIKTLDNIILTVFTTACNPLNTRIVKRYTQFQIQDELVGRASIENSLAGTDHLPFLEIRKQIIKSYHPVLTDEEVKLLAKVSRGLHKADIHKIADDFLKSGSLPLEMSHPTNTCDPYTGSWSERVITLEEYESIYKENQFNLKVQTGFYNTHQTSTVKKNAAILINRFIALFPFFGFRIAPFIFLIGKK